MSSRGFVSDFFDFGAALLPRVCVPPLGCLSTSTLFTAGLLVAAGVSAFFSAGFDVGVWSFLAVDFLVVDLGFGAALLPRAVVPPAARVVDVAGPGGRAREPGGVGRLALKNGLAGEVGRVGPPVRGPGTAPRRPEEALPGFSAPETRGVPKTIEATNAAVCAVPDTKLPIPPKVFPLPS